MRVWISVAAVLLLAGCEGAKSVPGGSGTGGSGTGASGSAARGAGSSSGTAVAPPLTGGEESSQLSRLQDKNLIAQPDVTLVLKDYDGLQALIASKKGKVVVVDAWSTYCDPCMKEFPGLVGLHKKYGPEKIACISICTNYTGVGNAADEMAEPLQFLKKQGATFDNLMSSEGDESLFKKLKIPSVPSIFVYDADGKLAKLFDKETSYAEVEKVVTPLVK